MVHVIPGNLRGPPELQAVGCRASVKPIVEGAIVTLHVFIPVGVEQLIDGQVAGNAYGLPAHQECHEHDQRNLHSKPSLNLHSSQRVLIADAAAA